MEMRMLMAHGLWVWALPPGDPLSQKLSQMPSASADLEAGPLVLSDMGSRRQGAEGPIATKRESALSTH